MVSIQSWARRGAGSYDIVSPDESEDGGADEQALLAAGHAGDRTALDQLLALHERPLFALCYSILGHAEDAEDAVQETFLRALRALPGFRGDAAFRTWLFRIGVNVCLKRKADRTPAVPWDAQPDGASPSTASPETIALRQLRLMEALRALLPRQRAVLLLKEREGWSLAEIAAAMGWKERQVRYELSKARQALVEWRRRDAGEGDET